MKYMSKISPTQKIILGEFFFLCLRAMATIIARKQ